MARKTKQERWTSDRACAELERWEMSGLSMAEYCRRQKIRLGCGGRGAVHDGHKHSHRSISRECSLLRVVGNELLNDIEHGAAVAVVEQLLKLVGGKTVTIKVATIGKYGRTVATVLVGGKSLNAELVKAGLAWHHKKYSKDKRLVKFEAAAR